MCHVWVQIVAEDKMSLLIVFANILFAVSTNQIVLYLAQISFSDMMNSKSLCFIKVRCQFDDLFSFRYICLNHITNVCFLKYTKSCCD